MILTNGQEKALKIILDKYKNHEKYVTICGWAGVGKTTLVKFAIEAMQVNPRNVAYATFTGKAAEVLRHKGNKNAMTLHKLLYKSVPKKDGTFIRVPRSSLEYSIVVVDEISLAPKSMLDLLLSYGNVFCIFMGDNFQLPQIRKEDSHNFLEKADIVLTEIMRQALESEIIQITTKIREGKTLPLMKGKEVIICDRKDLRTGHLKWADVVLSATNKTRHSFNQKIRKLNGFEGNEIQNGEKIIFKKNYWNSCNEEGDALVNGSIGIIRNPFESFIKVPAYICGTSTNFDTTICSFEPEGGLPFTNLTLDNKFFFTEQFGIPWDSEYKMLKSKKWNELIPMRATWGYGLTVHSAQGSEWSKVLVYEENFPFDREEHKRWLYTASTRAIDKLVIIRS